MKTSLFYINKNLTLLVIFFSLNFFSQTSWNVWIKYNMNPIFSNPISTAWDAASDPAVIKENAGYKMVVSADAGLSPGSPNGNRIVLANSSNGYSWAPVSNGQDGMVLTSNVGVWDESMEMPELIKKDSTYLLFYCGYDPQVSDSSGGLIWGDLGLATSTNGNSFTKVGSPVMTRTQNWYDQDGITDPTIVERGDTLFMIYVGWCTQSCSYNNNSPAFYVLKAISVDDGYSWIKKGLLDSTSYIGLQHPDLVKDGDGKYSLFYGVDNACSTKIGVYQAQALSHPFGTYTPVATNPVFCLGTQNFEHAGTDGAFPTVINDNGQARMYYTGVDESNFIYKIGLIESNSTVGLDEAVLNNVEVKIYPNPSAKNKINIVLNLNTEATLKVMNLLGEVLEIRQVNGNSIQEIDCSNFVSGVYYVQLLSGNAAVTKKILIE